MVVDPKCKNGNGIFSIHKTTGKCYCCASENSESDTELSLSYNIYDAKQLETNDCSANTVRPAAAKSDQMELRLRSDQETSGTNLKHFFTETEMGCAISYQLFHDTEDKPVDFQSQVFRLNQKTGVLTTITENVTLGMYKFRVKASAS